MREFKMRVRVDAGRGQAHSAHIAHDSSGGRRSGRPGAHLFHQAATHDKHGIVDFFQGRKQPRPSGRAFARQGHNASGPDRQRRPGELIRTAVGVSVLRLREGRS